MFHLFRYKMISVAKLIFLTKSFFRKNDFFFLKKKKRFSAFGLHKKIPNSGKQNPATTSGIRQRLVTVVGFWPDLADLARF